jgi:hypothetical protein
MPTSLEDPFDLRKKHIAGRVKLTHHDKLCRSTQFCNIEHLTNVLNDWIHEIVPATRRGDAVSLIIEFDTEKNNYSSNKDKKRKVINL